MQSWEELKNCIVALEAIFQGMQNETFLNSFSTIFTYSVSWYKDGEPYPWLSSNTPLPILFGRNQSLVIVNMTPQDEGQYRCVASNGPEEIHHQTMLRSYSMPNFQHLPIWNEEPEDQIIEPGQDLSLNCSATVGSQYNSVILQPVRAFWKDSNVSLIEVFWLVFTVIFLGTNHWF